MQTIGLTYPEWNQAIGNFCFQETNAGKPIRFSIDPLILQEASHNLKQTEVYDTPEDAATDFVKKVVQKMKENLTDPWWFRMGTQDKKPNHLAKLAIQVLAVFYMSPNEEGESSYWESLRKLVKVVDPKVGLGGWGSKRFSEYQENWKELRCWCNDICKGKYGELPNETNLKGYKHVKIPLAHGLLRQEDIQKLPQFFKKVGFRAGWDIDLNEFRKKINAHKDQMEYFPSSHCRRVLAESERFEGAVRQILYAFRQWDGLNEVDLGKKRQNRVRLVLHLSGNRLEKAELTNLSDRDKTLEKQFRIEDGQICSTHSYNPYDPELVIAKKEDRGFTETNFFRRGEEIAIACPSTLLRQIEPSLKSIAKKGKVNEVTPSHPFENWRIVKLRVKKNLTKKEIRCEQLRERFKSPRTRIELIGGLRYENKWLEGVGPTIRIKRYKVKTVLVDETPIEIENGVLSPEICPILNEVGKHEIRIEGTRIRKSFEVYRPEPQLIRCANSGWSRSTIDLWPSESDRKSNETITGSKIEGIWPRITFENRVVYPIEVLWSRLTTLLRIGIVSFDKETKELIRVASTHSNLLIKQIAELIRIRFRGKV
ncbi:MAG: hypothetical protein N2112_02095 [Gemmataceae bacterium]|jgi:hypothetical protein|nr:hypothetical protein [Gemmataceae bacterium]